MDKQFITAPVVLDDEGYTGGWFILYVANEGEVFQSLPMRNEGEADAFIHDYERTGKMVMYNPLSVGYQTLEPVFMLKAQATKAVRKQWRYIEVEDEKKSES